MYLKAWSWHCTHHHPQLRQQEYKWARSLGKKYPGSDPAGPLSWMLQRSLSRIIRKSKPCVSKNLLTGSANWSCQWISLQDDQSSPGIRSKTTWASLPGIDRTQELGCIHSAFLAHILPNTSAGKALFPLARQIARSSQAPVPTKCQFRLSESRL